jgi:uncharacterized C2H2 Zn-finger protein
MENELTTTKKLSCPECGKKYDTTKGLSSHRRNAHGVAGSAPSTLWQRRQKERESALKFKCPECGESFVSNMKLGLHRRNKHGVKGSAIATVNSQLKRERYLANYQRNAEGLLLCPECDKPCQPVGITFHRKAAHGLSGVEQERLFEVARAERGVVAVIETPADDTKCPQCDFVAQNKRGLIVHLSTTHKQYSTTPDAIQHREKRKKNLEQPTQVTAIEVTRNGHQESHPVADGHALIPDAALAVALGRFQGLCTSFAAEYDLPPRMFAARLAELIYNSQVRTAPRSGVRLPPL